MPSVSVSERWLPPLPPPCPACSDCTPLPMGVRSTHTTPGGDVDELIDDAQEYDCNIQVEEELAAYIEDETLDDEGGSSARNDKRVSEEATCVVEQNNKRQKACPGQKRRIVTVTQWDASARKQMISQLGQRGVT